MELQCICQRTRLFSLFVKKSVILWYHGKRPTEDFYQVIKAMLTICINDHY